MTDDDQREARKMEMAALFQRWRESQTRALQMLKDEPIPAQLKRVGE